MAYQAVIFDFDGTLADSFPCFVRAMSDAGRRHGFLPLDSIDYESLRSLSARQLFKKMNIPFWKLQKVVREVRTEMDGRHHPVPLFPGVPAVLKQLKADGVQLALVSSNTQDAVAHILGEEIFGLFSFFGCSSGLFRKKRRFEDFLKSSGLSRSEVLCLGDEIRDAEAAQACGLDFAGVRWGFTHADALGKYATAPKPLVGDWDELRALILGARSS